MVGRSRRFETNPSNLHMDKLCRHREMSLWTGCIERQRRARMRVLVERIRRKYGYPLDLQEAAVQNVLQQAEALSTSWAA